MRLFSYVVAHDTGFAPNPYGKISTLATCKPAIRRVAKKGDWIVGLTPKALGKRRVIYAMKITDRKTFEEYDKYCSEQKPIKTPQIPSAEKYEHYVGDNIYNSSKGGFRQSRHLNKGMEHDLKGEYVLLSKYFYYFGENAQPLKKKFSIIIPKRGHKSKANENYKDTFVEWIENNSNFKKYFNPKAPKPLDEIDDWKSQQKEKCRSKIKIC